MKEYPKILGVSKNDETIGQNCICFDKADGSNLRFEFNWKKGWYKFGTRRRMMDKNDPEYGCAIEMFINKYGQFLENLMKSNYRNSESLIAFAEFAGPYSFGGLHADDWLHQKDLMPKDKTNASKDVILFDLNVHKHGFIDPFRFVELCREVETPKIVYQGVLTEEFIQDVRNDKYDLKEGIVAKGGSGHKIWMRKVKTFSYLKKIQQVFETGWQNFWE